MPGPAASDVSTTPRSPADGLGTEPDAESGIDSGPDGHDAQPRTRRPVPVILLAAAVALVVPLRAAVGPIRDIDYYWHLLVGQDILAGIPVAEAGRGWSFAPIPDTWVSTQWLAEVLFAWLYDVGGMQTAIVYRTVTTLLVLATLAWATLRHRPVRAGVWLFALAAAELSIFAQERSQQLTYILAPLVGLGIERLWREGRLPRWWVVLPTVLVWAQFHGGWIVVPLGLGLGALARLLDDGWRDRVAYRAIGLAVLTLPVACLAPAGIDNVTAVRRFAASVVIIVEWQPVRPWESEAVPFSLMAILAVVTWARGRVRPSSGEVALVVALAVFALAAWRNVPVATLMLAPILTGSLARALGEPDPVPAGTRPRLAWVAVTLAAVGAVAGLVISAAPQQVVDPTFPLRLFAAVKDAPGQKVFNDYNISGPLLWFGGGPPDVRVAIDGRADRYGADYALRFSRTISGAPGWESMFSDLKPTAALLKNTTALPQLLIETRGWKVERREGDFVLLRAPGSTGWPAP